jgi:thioredoxin
MKKSIFTIMLISIFSLGITLSSCSDKEDNTTADNEDQVEVTDNTSDNIVEDNVVEDNVVDDNVVKVESPKGGKVHQLTTSEFKENIFDYMSNSEWNYKGTLPCVIDFYADWCGPCKMVAPIMDELAEELEGKVVFYKLDVDAEGEVAGVFGVQSIPSILYVPANGEPQMSVGAMEKEGYLNALNQIFFGAE